MSRAIKCYLIRHGATKGNQEGRYVGKTDEPVLESELERLRMLGKSLLPVDHIYVSPYLRCRQSAEALFSGLGCSTEIISDFREMDFGEFEYHNYQELNGDPNYQVFIDSSGTTAFPGGEEPGEFKERCRRAFLTCVSQADEYGWQRILFVVHGGTIMAIMEAFAVPQRSYFDFQVENGCGYEASIGKMRCLEWRKL